MTRQAQWQEKMRKAGLCTICGQEKLAHGSRNLGEKCAQKRRETQRQAGAFKAWRRGGPGRPPLHARDAEEF